MFFVPFKVRHRALSTQDIIPFHITIILRTTPTRTNINASLGRTAWTVYDIDAQLAGMVRHGDWPSLTARDCVRRGTTARYRVTLLHRSSVVVFISIVPWARRFLFMLTLDTLLHPQMFPPFDTTTLRLSGGKTTAVSCCFLG